MKILGIEHIGIAVNSIDESAPFWKTVLGLDTIGFEEVKSQAVMTGIFDTLAGKVELLEGLSNDSPIRKFISKRGPGIHHVCFEVEDVSAAIKELKDNGIRVIRDKPMTGAEGYKVIFVHPQSTGGVLVELAEKP